MSGRVSRPDIRRWRARAENAIRATGARLATLDMIQVRDRAAILGVVVVAAFGTVCHPWLGYDAHAYWAVNPADPYNFDYTPDQYDAFRYSPAAAQLFGLFRFLPWPLFALLWFGFLAVLLVWLARGWTLAVLAFPAVAFDIYLGNVEVLLAAAIVLGFRYPATWAVVLLTKVTPGVGLVWFAARREWRNLAIALGATAVIAGVSFLAAPNLWFQWPQAILAVRDRPSMLSVIIRIVAAVLLVTWGARTDRRWTVVVGGTLALGWLDIKTAAMLVGLAAFLPRLEGTARSMLPTGLRIGGFGRTHAAG
jgi:Glycosyltransferase family 87